ncbi:transcription antitermination protein nusG [Thalassoporum mexicanum PCC 7367]|uniref:transcription termination/antitermination protein NusG n=1 Tax=Thalassoporum mexicanum TaxID=3457544 RepID=UPI00029F93B4|nr:transcription termination/antitermination protein NusG [Pseudanabaena sp. PCC 7367]AFY68653.1 transcription antitermination protein nusG [Pseudanabaena sp. PCC 7367]
MFAEEQDPDNLEAEIETEATAGQASGIKPRWYAVQVASGCEKKVKANLEQRLDTLEVQDLIHQIEIPQTPTVKIRKDGSRQSAQEKVFPGYVLIKMNMDDHAWQVVKNTPHVINFVGTEQKRPYGRGRGHVTPRPLSRSEAERIFRIAVEQETIVKIDMAAGDKIKVLSGPFKDFEGEVVEVTPERSKLKALLSIFGRDTPVELEFNQVEKQN